MLDDDTTPPPPSDPPPAPTGADPNNPTAPSDPNAASEEERIAAEWAAAMATEGEDSLNGNRPSPMNQSQIDSLFDITTDTAKPVSGIETLINSRLVNYERLPMLEIIFDRMVREMSSSLRQFTSDNVDVSIETITTVRFGDFINDIPLPAMIAVFAVQEWNSYGLITADSSLIYSIVDVLLGGRRIGIVAKVEGRPYTTIERNLTERLVQVILKDLTSSFAPVSRINFLFDRLETNPRFVAIERPGNAAVLIRVKIEMDDRGGKIDFLIPYSTLEPIRNLLLQMFMGEKFGRDSIWETHLAFESLISSITLEAVMDQTQLTLKDVLNWKIGSQVAFRVRPDSNVTIRSGKRSLFTGRMGQRNHNIAIQIEDIIQEDPEKGAMLEEVKRQEEKRTKSLYHHKSHRRLKLQVRRTYVWLNKSRRL